MSVVFDPHGTVAENVQTKEAQTLPATGPRLIFPTHGPFYTDLEFKLFDGTKELQEQVHYYKVLPYATGVLRTARRIHGAILVIDDTVSRALTVTYHPVGINAATAAQKTAFIAGNTVFTDKYWEDVVGDPYFPPVDVQFDWDNWCGERELMDALGVLADGLKYKQPQKDPLLTSVSANPPSDYSAARVTFDAATGRHNFALDTIWRFDFGNGKAAALENYVFEAEYYLPKAALNTDVTKEAFNSLVDNSWAVPFVCIGLRHINGAFRLQLMVSVSSAWQYYDIATVAFPAANFAKPFRIRIARSEPNQSVEVQISNDTGVLGKMKVEHNNPPAAIANTYAQYNVAARLAGTTDLRTTLQFRNTGYMQILQCPGFTAGITEDIKGLLTVWYKLLRESFDQSPAREHILRKDNPHNEEAGWIKALVRNGISADAVRIYNRTLPQLTTYVNGLAPTAANLATKVRRETTARLLRGTIVGVEGLTQHTQGSDASNIRILSKFDKLQSWLIARNDNISVTAAQYIDIKAGTGVLRLYNDGRGLTWNGSKLLTHDTVGPYIPQGGAAAAGFVGVSTATITLTGKGIGSSPFVATWKEPSAADLSALAMRMVTDDFGTSSALAATPALITKLAANFTGKLLKGTANINGVKLAGSITLSKSMYGLSEVVDISDMLMPMSTAMETLIADYENDPNHTHPASMFGIVNATTTVKGLVKLGGLENDATIALDGREVLAQSARLDAVDTESSDTLSPAVINILRYGNSGTGLIEGVETEDYMVSLPASSYYCGGKRTVAAKSYNLVDLFPGAYTNKTFYVYVDAVADGTAVYSISGTRRQENDTLTEIGTVVTDGDSIVRAVINNVTRLGGFREFTEHVDNPNAHNVTTVDKDSVGLSSIRNIPAAVGNYKVGFTNGLRDWQSVFNTATWTQAGQTLMLTNYGAGQVNAIGLVHSQKQAGYTLRGTVATDTTADNGGWLGWLLSYRQVKTEEHTLSIIANPDAGGWVTDSGQPTIHAVVIDAGKSSQIIIPGVTARSATQKLSQLVVKPIVITRVGNVFTVQPGAVSSLDAVTEKFVIDFDAMTVVVSNSLGQSKTTQLEPLMRAKGIATDFFLGSAMVGVLGLYKSKSTYTFQTHPTVNPAGMYSTLGSLIDNVSPLSKVRVARGDLSSATLTQAQIQTEVGQPAFLTADSRGITYLPENCSYYSNKKAYAMLMVRSTK
ncbi:virion structural protein [Erwinia phage vB_EamM_EarlPhillipIV]|uniref:Virion structural protein n=1 Tax=Erwinia phage vB_EamM_EarlPhillipIV TaxID=1883372 RepID=A0A1B2ICS9_9CAUD|nr:virion structural protein [Erwinia phage vB_EamM_EarlPhillipIV]ANZ49015.1 hypothetical protein EARLPHILLIPIV_166 [Erwinia phage vB_EamM_EarlPhillipIV]